MEKYKKISEQFLQEVNAKMTIYEHIKTGAHICTLDSEDTNKVFAIAFKTPALNNTGVTHIIEHSVLCGSKKYPVKDPFVELIKGSLNTFLNAFTYPDKTVYPCASKNDKDFKNLMDIYLNAVLYPRIYSYKNIFLQEGWHYELFNKADPIKINGVVYNEMKGAYSDKDSCLYDALSNGLYPDNTYQYDSGGNPEYIPTLTYDFFKDFHHKYYSPSNAYIYLYGKMDMKERLDYLDREYLSKFDKIDIHPEIKKSKDFDKMHEKVIYYPVNAEEKDLENKTNFGINYNLSLNTDIKKGIAFTILDKVILSSTSALIKERLLKAHLGSDISGGFNSGILENSFAIVAKDVNNSKKEEFLKILNDCFKDLVNGKLDHESINATISNMEFATRENKFQSYPQGLSVILKSLDSWLYDLNLPSLNLNVLPYYEELKRDLTKGYFENLIKEYFIDNKHVCFVTQIPSTTIQAEKDNALNKKLADYKASLSDKELDDLIKMNEDLRKYQSEGDTKEQLATIPHLSLKDLDAPVDDYPLLKTKDKFNFYYNNYFTNKIVYGGLYFDVKKIPLKYASKISLLAALYTRLATKNYNETKLDQIINLYSGNVDAVGYINRDYKDSDYTFFFGFEFSTFEENLAKNVALIKELMVNTIFSNKDKLLEVINSEKSRLESASVRGGHVFAMQRAMSFSSKANYINDCINGIAYLDFVSDLSSNFKDKADALIIDLELLTKYIFTKENFFAFATCETGEEKKYLTEAESFYASLKDKEALPCDEFVFTPSVKKEAFIAPFDVNYVARACLNNAIKVGGKNEVLINALSMDYYWQLLRVKGGAYGGGIVMNFLLPFGLYSYRDPHVKETNDVYLKTPEFISKLNYTDEEILKFKIGAISNGQLVLHASDAGKRGLMLYLRGYTHEDAVNNYRDLLSTTNKDLVDFAPKIKELLNTSSLCVIGGEKQINANKEMFDNIRNLLK